jgi:SAM-dependent methyltransferase
MKIIRQINFYRRLFKLLKGSLRSLSQLPQTKDLQLYFEKYSALTRRSHETTTLDIGCGTNPRNPFAAQKSYGIDIRENLEKNIKYADLTVEKIPYPDAHFDYITAYDFLEHVPRVIYLPERRFPFVELMNEIHRTLKPNGIFLSHTPIYPFSPAFRDPTHVNIITEETFPMYFDDTTQAGKMYGFNGSFKILDQVLKGPHLISILQKSA